MYVSTRSGHFRDSTGTPMQLEDLFVKPKARNKGIGKALFGELSRVAKAKVVHSISPLVDQLPSSSLTELRACRLVRAHGGFWCLK